MPRVLVIAEEANPSWVSVPLVGWSHARALADVADVHLVTQVRNREAIVAAGLHEGADFTPIDSERVARPLWTLGNALRGGTGRGWTTLTALSSLSYRYFEHLVWKRFGPDLRAGVYDLVHRITPLSPTIPSALAGRCRKAGVPFMLGPLNGGVPWPRGFDGARRREREWLSYVRDAYRLLPGYHATRRHASAIIVGSRDTLAQMPTRYHDKCVYVPENGIDPDRFDLGSPLPPRPPGPLRMVFVGRLVPYKGPDMLLEAATPLLARGAATLEVLGDGPMMAEMRDMVRARGLEEAVHLHGWVEHRDVREHLERGDVLAFPSIREFGGGVVLEAMAVGLVPVVVDYGGPAELVTPETGHAVPIDGRAQIIRSFADVLETISADPAALAPMATAARERVRALFTWPAKARQTLEVYEWVLGRRDKPDYGMPLREPASSSAAAPDTVARQAS